MSSPNYLAISKERILNKFTQARSNSNKTICKHPSMLVADCIDSNTMAHRTMKPFLTQLRLKPSRVNSNSPINIPRWCIDYKEFVELYDGNIYDTNGVFKKKIDVSSIKYNKQINISGKISTAIMLAPTAWSSFMAKNKDKSKEKFKFKIKSVHYRYQRNDTLIYANTHCNKRLIIPDLAKKVFTTPDFKKSMLFEKISGFNFSDYSASKILKYEKLINLYKSSINIRFIDSRGSVLNFINIERYLSEVSGYNKSILKAMAIANKNDQLMFKFYDSIFIYDIDEYEALRVKIMNYLLDVDINHVMKTFDKAKSIPKAQNPALMKQLKQIGFKATPFEHQDVGISWLYGLYKNNLPGAILGDDMGLGKTLQGIAFLALSQAKKILIVSPASVIGVWESEIEKFYPKLTKYVRIMSYEALRTKTLLTEYDIIVLDEAQKVKNAATISAGVLRRLHAKFKLILTGTPIENGINDLFSLITIIIPDSKKMLDEIMNTHAKDQIHGVKLTKSLIDGLYLSRKMSNKQLPVKLNKFKVNVKLSNEERLIYDNIIKYYSEQLNEISNDNSAYYRAAIVGLMRVVQAVSYSAQLPREIIPNNITPSKFSKMEALQKIATRITSKKEKLVVFARFTATIDYIKSMFNNALVIKGDVANAERSRIVEKFQNDDRYSIIIISIQAGATGLTLTAANNLAFVDIWWNPAVMEQAARRIYRIGQTKDCNVYYINAIDTIDDSILKILLSKSQIINALDDKSTAQSGSFAKDLIDDVFKVKSN